MIPLELVYRSRPIQYPLLAAMKACKAWEQSGIELKSVKFVSGAAQSDPMLIQGECDFIFGSHISPYIHRYHRHPFGCGVRLLRFDFIRNLQWRGGSKHLSP